MVATIIGISAVASLFLAWLVYYHPPIDVAGTRLAFLPALDAVLNALCAVFLVVGFRYVKYTLPRLLYELTNTSIDPNVKNFTFTRSGSFGPTATTSGTRRARARK